MKTAQIGSFKPVNYQAIMMHDLCIFKTMICDSLCNFFVKKESKFCTSTSSVQFRVKEPKLTKDRNCKAKDRFVF